MENLFEKGCLIQLSTSVWGARRKIDPGRFSDMASAHEWLSANKKLVDPEALKPIKKVVNSARSYIAGASLPFPLNGLVFMPKEMIARVDEKLTGIKEDFDLTVDGFLESYDELRSAATVCLGDLFNESDYPVDIRNKFSFVWRFVILDVPNGNTALLAPEVYEREKKKFIDTMEQARELAVDSLRQEFAGMVQRITERFSATDTSKPKIFKNSTVNHFYEYFETFKDRNIFRDEQLAELVEQAQAIMGGTPPDLIRSDDQLKEGINAGMQDVEKAMADIFTMPRRKIDLN
jgi:hypothetical protein